MEVIFLISLRLHMKKKKGRENGDDDDDEQEEEDDDADYDDDCLAFTIQPLKRNLHSSHYKSVYPSSSLSHSVHTLITQTRTLPASSRSPH